MSRFLQPKFRLAVSTLCVSALAAACQSKYSSPGKDPVEGTGTATGATGTGGSAAAGSGGGAVTATSSGGASTQTTSSGGTAGVAGVGGTGAGGVTSSSGGSGAGAGAAGAPDPGLALGETCSAGDDCESGQCADGVCCNEACSGVCMQCDAADSVGTCVAAASDTACGELECPPSTDCREYTADDLANNCADKGVCVTEASCTIMNDPDDATCGTTGEPGLCDGEGECVIEGKAGLGDTCAMDDDCASLYCVEGLAGGSICCDAPCDGVCEGCGSDGHCDAAPEDDDRCDIDCADDTACQMYPADPTGDRCQGFGQCVTEAAYCAPSNVDAGTNCGTNRSCDGSGECVLTCPTNAGAGRTCTSECPCGTGEGVCTANNQCDAGLACASGAGSKFGFAGNDTCLPTHCNNDVQDSGETSIDCGGECGCTVRIAWFAGSGFIEAISDDGSTIVGRTTGSSGYGYSWNEDLEMTELGSAAYGVNGDGSAIVGSDDGPVRWLGGATSASPLSTAQFSGGSGYAATSNGQVIVGTAYDSLGLGAYAFIWNNGSITWDTALRSFLDVSANGQVLLAEDLVSDYFVRTSSGDEAVVLPAGRALLDRPVLSRDGKLVAGAHVLDAASGGGDNKGYIYEVGSGEVATVFEGDGSPFVMAVANTRLMVGQIGRGGVPGIYWHPDEGYSPKLITELMVAHGFELDASTTIGGAEAMTPDGRVIVGAGGNGEAGIGKYKLMFDITP